MKTNVNQTSIANHEINRRAGVYGPQAAKLLSIIKHSPGMTRNELACLSGMPINVVSGRCNDLMRAGKVKTDGKRRCSVSGRMVWAIVPAVRAAVFVA